MRAIDLDGVPAAEPTPVAEAWCTMCGLSAIAELDLCVACARARLQVPIPAYQPFYPPVSVPFVQPWVNDNTYDDEYPVAVTTTGGVTVGDTVVFHQEPAVSVGAHLVTIANIGTGTLTLSNSTAVHPPSVPPQDIVFGNNIFRNYHHVDLG
jgi:hypothetical protein